jgi:hypothetical protein
MLFNLISKANRSGYQKIWSEFHKPCVYSSLILYYIVFKLNYGGWLFDLKEKKYFMMRLCLRYVSNPRQVSDPGNYIRDT